MRDFGNFLDFCDFHLNGNNYPEYNWAFDRVVNYEDNNHHGHFIQLFYAIYDFYTQHPSLKSYAGSPSFDSINPTILSQWRIFLNNNNNSTYDYSVQLIKEKLPYSCGGYLEGGGGWSPTAKLLFSVLAIY